MSDIYILEAFDVIKSALSKQELRHLLRKLKLPDKRIDELEAAYNGKDKLVERAYNSLLAWKDMAGDTATVGEIARVLHLMGLDDLERKVLRVQARLQAPHL